MEKVYLWFWRICSYNFDVAWSICFWRPPLLCCIIELKPGSIVFVYHISVFQHHFQCVNQPWNNMIAVESPLTHCWMTLNISCEVNLWLCEACSSTQNQHNSTFTHHWFNSIQQLIKVDSTAFIIFNGWINLESTLNAVESTLNVVESTLNVCWINVECLLFWS